jgi:hypothetical protein
VRILLHLRSIDPFWHVQGMCKGAPVSPTGVEFCGYDDSVGFFLFSSTLYWTVRHILLSIQPMEQGSDLPRVRPA